MVAATPAETTAVPPTMTISRGCSRLSSARVSVGMAFCCTSRMGPPSSPAAGPAPRASGKLAPVAM